MGIRRPSVHSDTGILQEESGFRRLSRENKGAFRRGDSQPRHHADSPMRRAYPRAYRVEEARFPRAWRNQGGDVQSKERLAEKEWCLWEDSL